MTGCRPSTSCSTAARTTARVEDGGFDPPRGAFFLGRVDGAPVAMGGWRRRRDVHPWGLTEAAEVKRMYVAPEARRPGTPGPCSRTWRAPPGTRARR